MNPEDIQRQLQDAFRIEAEERIASMFNNLTELEKCTDPDDRSRMLEIVFREAHSLKGAARSVNILPVEAVCQEMEGLFTLLKNGKVYFSAELFDTLHHAVGLVEKYIASPVTDQVSVEKAIQALTQTLLDFKAQSASPEHALEPVSIKAHENTNQDSTAPLKNLPELPDFKQSKPVKRHAEPAIADFTKPAPAPQAQALSRSHHAETIRISTAKLDALLLKAEEMITLKQTLSQHQGEIKETLQTIKHWKKISEKSKKEMRELHHLAKSHPKLERFIQLHELNHAQIEETDARMSGLSKSVEHSSRSLGAMVDELLEEMKKTSLLPFSTLFSLVPRMIRDISKGSGKEIELEMTGGDVEIDKRILEGLKDSLIHLIRNAVDHGIETPEIRTRCRKSPWGTIRLSVVQPESNKVEIELSDDGHGIDIAALKQKATATGCISSRIAAGLTDAEALSLIWLSGISTSPMITEISGRGLGMAIVQEHVENLNGLISISTDSGRGTAFKIELPVSLATFRGMIVSAGGHQYILPITHVEHTLRIHPDDIKTVGNKSIIPIDGQAVSLVYLSDILGLPQTSATAMQGNRPERITLPAAVLGGGDKRIACIVDHIANEQDVLVKSLGKQLRRIPNISGATILGDGKVVPILNVNEIIASSAGKSIPAIMSQTIETLKHKVKKSVLIVEDSFTSRTLLKNILEASGYHIITAIDGEDGYSQLLTQPFDAVVSDVEMPKMNGFELTRKIREHETLAAMPVVLVTSLDSREDKEKGMDAGANAYIVKSSFDQSNLLEVLERLI